VSPASIYDRQNTPGALRAARAFRRRYALAKRCHALRLGVSVLIGTVGVILALLEPSTTDYVAATAAAWTVLSRTLLLALERGLQEQGALAQEAFDVHALGLPWNASTAGREPAPEDLRNWGERQPEDDVRDWYADVRPALHPLDALICQRASLTWARQDHGTYAHILRIGATATLLLTIVLGLALDLSLGEYLLRLGVPVLPAILDLFDVAGSNAALGRSRARIADEADKLYITARDSAVPPSVDECRSLQDQIFATRRVMGAPAWFYRLTHRKRQRNMEEVAAEQVRLLPESLLSG
jgi:SMODS-associating 4TM effector domain